MVGHSMSERKGYKHCVLPPSLPPSSLQGESDSTTDLDTSLKGESHHDLERLLASLAGVHAIMCPANGQGNTRRK